MQLFQHANFIPNIPSTECATSLSYHRCTHMYSQLSWHRGWSGASESHRLKQQLMPFNLTRHALIIELANYNLVGTRCAVQHARDILLLLPYYYILPHLYDKAFLKYCICILVCTYICVGLFRYILLAGCSMQRYREEKLAPGGPVQLMQFVNH